MVAGGHIVLLERLARAMASARARGDDKTFERLKRWHLYLYLHERYASLRSPRVRYHSSHFGGVKSFWATVRSKGIPAMFMRFLGFPPNLFYAIADAMRPHLAPYDRELHVSVAGKRTRLDHVDVTAVTLRRLQIGGPTLRFLEQDFAVVASVLSGAGKVIDLGRRALFAVMTGGTLSAARICYPSLQEGHLMWEGLCKQLGYPKYDWGGCLILLMDGTVTPLKNVSNDDLNKLFYGAKGTVQNHVFVVDVAGHIVDYHIGLPGCMHDQSVAPPCVANHQDPAVNPHKWGMIVDSGFKGSCTNTPPVIFRPLVSEKVDAAHIEFYEECSRYFTRIRQYNEHINGAIKRSFIYLNAPILLSQRSQFNMDLISCLHLFNYRTRTIGFNQCRTAIMPHVDANFRHMLEAGGNLDKYLALCDEYLRDAL
jgi:hypothetical protein